MSDNQGEDEFDEIVNGNKDSDKPSELNFRTIMEAVQQVYPHLYDGLLVRSLVIIDRVDGNGDRELMWVHGADSQPWEVLGMVQQVLHDMQAENNVAIHSAIMRGLAVDEEDDEDSDD